MEESHCRTGEFDSPNGKKWTVCKQIFSIRKLLAIDEDGVISVDSFELPSACLCEYNEVSNPFEIQDRRLIFVSVLHWVRCKAMKFIALVR